MLKYRNSIKLFPGFPMLILSIIIPTYLNYYGLDILIVSLLMIVSVTLSFLAIICEFKRGDE